MAIVGASYTIDPYPRTPESVLESLFRTPDKLAEAVSEQLRPNPVCKHVRACMDRDEKETLRLLKAETAGIEIMSDTQESELSGKLVEKEKSQKKTGLNFLSFFIYWRLILVIALSTTQGHLRAFH